MKRSHFPTCVFLLSLLTCSEGLAQLTLDKCYELTEKHYPLIRQQALIAEGSGYAAANVSKMFLPQVTVSGQASYQSQTVSISDALGDLFPAGIPLPSLSKDQYRVQAHIQQVLYDGGNAANARQRILAGASIEKNAVDVSLYAIRERVLQLYFGILLVQEQQQQYALKTADLRQVILKTASALQFGTAPKSSLDELRAELIQAETTTTELLGNRYALLRMLGIFTGQELDTATVLQTPEMPPVSETSRPEIRLFESRSALLDHDEAQLRTDLRPRLSAFFTGAYGRPTLNILDNGFGPWYLTGIQLNWQLGSLYTIKNNRQKLRVQREKLRVEEAVFRTNTQLLRAQQQQDLEKFRQLIGQDQEAAALRSAVKMAAESQLENGVITTHEYINKLNAENVARLSLAIHQLQLLQAQHQLQFLTGP